MRVVWRVKDRYAMKNILLAEHQMHLAGIDIEAFTEGGGSANGCYIDSTVIRRVWVLDNVGRVTFETAGGSFVKA